MGRFPAWMDDDAEVWPGCWRAQVASVSDSEERVRYRVRVFHVHADDVPIAALPYAEWGGAFSFKGGGDLPPWEVGDLVWVMFEGGNREYPVILGGWQSQSGGVPDVLMEQQQDYEAAGRRRWIRKDRGGNVIEMSAMAGQEKVRIKSGRAEVVLTRLDNGIEITAKNGPVRLRSERVSIQSDEVLLEGGNTTVSATKQTPAPDPTMAIPTAGTPVGVCNVFSNKTLNLYGGSIPGTDPSGTVVVGAYVDAALVPRQSAVVRVAPQLLELGTSQTDTTLLPTLFVDVAASTRVRTLAPLVVLGVEAAADFLVKYTQLKLEFDTHTHGGVTSGGASTSPPAVPLTPAASTVNTKAS